MSSSGESFPRFLEASSVSLALTESQPDGPDISSEFLRLAQLTPKPPYSGHTPRIANVQVGVAFGDPLKNLEKLFYTCQSLAEVQVDLAVFPECFLTGYCVDNRLDAEAISLGRNSSVSESQAKQILNEIASEFAMHLVVGYAGLDDDGTLYNGACLVTPSGDLHEYRKSHLPELGFDKFATAGNELPVFDTTIGRIGILICFDMRFPEAARTLALAGADMIVIPTNWPRGAQCSSEHICIARAAENRVFVITSNRVGEENGFEFIGLSKIISPTGEVLRSLGSSEAVGIADIDLLEARTKRTVTIPGKYETDVFARRPELYGRLTQ